MDSSSYNITTNYARTCALEVLLCLHTYKFPYEIALYITTIFLQESIEHEEEYLNQLIDSYDDNEVDIIDDIVDLSVYPKVSTKMVYFLRSCEKKNTLNYIDIKKYCLKKCKPIKQIFYDNNSHPFWECGMKMEDYSFPSFNEEIQNTKTENAITMCHRMSKCLNFIALFSLFVPDMLKHDIYNISYGGPYILCVYDNLIMQEYYATDKKLNCRKCNKTIVFPIAHDEDFYCIRKNDTYEFECIVCYDGGYIPQLVFPAIIDEDNIY